MCECYIEVDNLVIGGGIAGTYLTARYRKLFPKETILLVDKLSNYGGLMTSSKIPFTNITTDLGPIRFFPSIHPRVDYLTRIKYKLPITEYLPSEDGQVAYLRNTAYRMDNLFPSSDNNYFIREDEKGINPFVTLEDNLKVYYPNPELLYLFDYRINLFKDVFLGSQTFKNIAQGNMSQENWQRISDILGYDYLLSSKINGIIGALESLTLSNKDSKQYRLTNGFQDLAITIAEKNNFRTLNYDKLYKKSLKKHKQNSVFNTTVLNIKFCEKYNKWKVLIGFYKANSPEQINYEPYEKKVVYAKKIFSAIPLLYLEKIHKFPNPNYNNIIDNSFEDIPLLRIFLYFEEDWMKNDGMKFGKSVTTLDGGQIIYYDNNVMMFYALGSQVSKLFGNMPPNKQIQKEMIPPNSENKNLIDECVNIIKTTFGKETLSKVLGISYANWIHPIRFYTGRNVQTFANNSLYDDIINLMFPYGMKGNFYVFDNSASFNNGWVEGSLEIVDFFFNLLYKQPLFGEELIN